MFLSFLDIEDITEDEIKFYLIFFWSMLHGYIAGCNNTLLTYMHDEPFQLKDQILKFMLLHIQLEIDAVKGGRERSYKK